jgi:DNA-binding transcriptional MerR regulator
MTSVVRNGADDFHGTYSIGEFARLSGVTPKALRHYDRIGVLRPAVVDAHSRYRRYAAQQLGELYELLSLARLGLSLRQAREVIERQGAAGSLARALETAKLEIESRVAEDSARLAWIGSKLEALRANAGEVESDMSSLVLKQEPPRRVLAVRDRLASYADADALFDELSPVSAPPAGLSCLRGTVWHDCGLETGLIDCEAVMLADPARRRRTRPRAGRIVDLPGTLLACVIHRGADESVGSTYAAARRWIAACGLSVVGPNREWYLSAGTEPVMEIQFPVAPARAQACVT